MGQGHDHGTGYANSSALTKALALTGTFLFAEVIGAYVFNSLALLSDAAHMLTDTLALAVALVAIRVGRRAADRRRTWGYHRFEILAAAFNASLLFLVAIYILYEAYQRFREPAEIGSIGMLLVAAFGLLVNWVSMRLLAGGAKGSLNVRGAYLEVWSDLLGSVAVIIGAGVIWATGWTWVDPVLGVAIALWVLPRTWTLLSESIDVLLESVPKGVDIDAVETTMLETPGVDEVHDLHVWTLTSGKIALSAHIVVSPTLPRDDGFEGRLNEALTEKFAITHVTIQTELAGAHGGDTVDRWGEMPRAGF